MGPRILTGPHWFDYLFFVCQHVSTSKPMFPNPVDLNLQWICCWFSATDHQLKSFCRSPLSKGLLNQWILWICYGSHTGLFLPHMRLSHFCIHCPRPMFSTSSSHNPQKSTLVWGCCSKSQMKNFSIVGPHWGYINIGSRADGAVTSVHKGNQLSRKSQAASCVLIWVRVPAKSNIKYKIAELSFQECLWKKLFLKYCPK